MKNNTKGQKQKTLKTIVIKNNIKKNYKQKLDFKGNHTMMDISSLTINDEVDNNDVPGLSQLSISELPPGLMCKFMPHVPVSPSPLRNAFHMEMLQEEMDIDEEGDCYDGTTPEDSCGTEEKKEDLFSEVVNESSENDEEITKEIHAIENITLKNTPEDNDLLEDPVEEEINNSDGENSETSGADQTIDKKSVIKALLSPTTLGIAAATKSDHLPAPHLSNSSPSSRRASAEEIPIEEIERKDSITNSGTLINTESIKRELRSRAQNNQPIHVSINTHNHFYPNMNHFMNNELIHSNQIYDHNNDNIHQVSLLHDEYQNKSLYSLPDPWSSKSRPASKYCYAITSYLQLFLNTVTVGILCFLIVAFIHALRLDVQAVWSQKRLEFELESNNCQMQFYENKCDRDSQLPALIDKCNEWSQCMNRNNDILFRARSSLTAKVIGDIINSLIEPMGWKTLSVILMGCTVWCFSTNFLLGFARARSYYGNRLEDRIKQLELHQQKEPTSTALITK